MTLIEREISQQPAVIRELLHEEQGVVDGIVKHIREFDPAFVLIAARGTSDNAARYAQYLWSITAGLPVALATPSVHTLYDASPNLSRALVVGISQSGQSEDVRRVLADANEQGALTVSITNDNASPLAQTATHSIFLHAGPERSVAATKTYTAQLTTVAMLGAALTGDPAMKSALERLPEKVEQSLECAEPVSERAQRYRYMDRLVVLGRGYNYASAFEISLKVKELCYVTAEAYSEADFRHGPIAMLTPGFPAIVVAPSGKTLPKIRDLLAKLAERQAETLVISDVDDLLDAADTPLRLPQGIPEWLSPVCAVLPGQVLAAHVAMAKGHDVDRPTGLNKVTVTE